MAPQAISPSGDPAGLHRLKQVTVTLPGAHFEIQGLQVSATTAADGTVSVGDKLSGTIYIDHITATASGTPDNAAPVVSASSTIPSGR